MTYQRSEPRFAIEVPTTIEVGDQQLKGAIKNISLNGLRAELPLPIDKDKKVSLRFSLPGDRGSFEAWGDVRWCQKSHTSYLAGIKVERPNDVALPIYLLSQSEHEKEFTANYESASNDLKAEIPTPSTSPGLFPVMSLPQNMFQELYLGLFFETFQRIIQKQLVRIACDLELAGFYLDNITGERGLSGNTREKLSEVTKRIQFLQNAFNNQVHFLRLMNIGKMHPPGDSLPEIIHLNDLLTARTHYFQELLSSLMVPYSGEMICKTEKTPPILASQANVTYGLDLLILFNYHTLSIASAKSIAITSYFDQTRGIICEFKNDGSKLFKEDCLEIHCASIQDQLQNCLGNRLYFWLCYALSFFKEQDCKLSICSESGNNTLVLSFPAHKLEDRPVTN